MRRRWWLAKQDFECGLRRENMRGGAGGGRMERWENDKIMDNKNENAFVQRSARGEWISDIERALDDASWGVKMGLEEGIENDNHVDTEDVASNNEKKEQERDKEKDMRPSSRESSNNDQLMIKNDTLLLDLAQFIARDISRSALILGAQNAFFKITRSGPDAPTKRPPQGQGKVGLGPNTVMDIARDLAEWHLDDGQGGCAALVLQEVLQCVRPWCGAEPTARVACLTRHVEILLAIYDCLNKKQKVCRFTTSEWLSRPCMTTDYAAMTPTMWSTFVESAQYSHDFEGKTLDMNGVMLRAQTCLFEAEGNIDEALNILATMHARDIVEPITMAPLLELRSAIYERQERGIESLHAMSRAWNIAERAAGQTDEITLRLLKDFLRLTIKYASVEGYVPAAKLATDLSKRIDVLTLRNPKVGDELGRGCSKLLSIAKLLENGELSWGDELIPAPVPVVPSGMADMRILESGSGVRIGSHSRVNSRLGKRGGSGNGSAGSSRGGSQGSRSRGTTGESTSSLPAVSIHSPYSSRRGATHQETEKEKKGNNHVHFGSGLEGAISVVETEEHLRGDIFGGALNPPSRI